MNVIIIQDDLRLQHGKEMTVINDCHGDNLSWYSVLSNLVSYKHKITAIVPYLLKLGVQFF